MTNTPSSGPSNSDEISLEDIDKLLETEDPAFQASMDQIRAVKADQNVEIKSSDLDEKALGTEEKNDVKKGPSRWRKVLAWVRARLASFALWLRNRIIYLAREALVFLKTRPKEIFLYSLSLIKVFFKTSLVPVKAFLKSDRTTKLVSLILAGVIGVSILVFKKNMHGIWIPQLSEPVLENFANQADWVQAIEPEDQGDAFYRAFPQDRHEFLFKKIKVNLKRPSENVTPMGAFEIIVLLDSEDTAVEVRDREVELKDLVSRVIEDETFEHLESDMGKARLKTNLKGELNKKLTQGWVKDISFKTFIIKP